MRKHNLGAAVVARGRASAALASLHRSPDGGAWVHVEPHGASATPCNEVFLLHGAPADAVDTICRDGLDPRRSGGRDDAIGHAAYQPMFGQGAYLAENASKSDIYASAPAGGAGERCVLLMRACLGKPFYARKELPELTRPPRECDCIVGVRRDEQIPADLEDGGGCGELDHREYVVYDPAATLPEFQIWYHHADGCACRKCVL